MKKLLTALFGAALVLSACGGTDDTPEDNAPTEQAPTEQAPTEGEAPVEGETPAGDDTANATFDEAKAQASFQTCAGCHGADLKGQGDFPPLVGTGLTKEEILTVIAEGKGDKMPAGLIQDAAEAENLAGWIAAQK